MGAAGDGVDEAVWVEDMAISLQAGLKAPRGRVVVSGLGSAAFIV
jgi:N-acetylglucosamine kinase-like BadF-type ATPase